MMISSKYIFASRGPKNFFVLAAVLVVALLLLCPAAPLRAQALSGINGTVTDATGAAIPGASVKITNVDTNVTRATESTSAGTYYITDLIPGTYTVRVEKAGFKVSVQKDVTVVGGTISTANAQLEAGTVSTEVVVNAPTVALQ